MGKQDKPVDYYGIHGGRILSRWKQRMQCVATDVDGTLTLHSTDRGPEGAISPAALESIHTLAQRGTPVILVSGRPLPALEGLALYLGLTDPNRTQHGMPLIAENGAVIKMYGKVKKLVSTKRGHAVRAVDKLMSRKPFKKKCSLTYDNEYRICDVGLHVAPDVMADLRRHFKGHPDLQVITSNIMAHVVCREINKARALKTVLKAMGVKKDRVVVFGDADSDIPLFRAFENTVAVANYFSDDRCKKERRLPAVKTRNSGGRGFAEVVKQLL